MRAFAWQDKKRGDRIEGLVHKLTTKDPFLMQETLRLGLGDLNGWTNTGVMVGATCGCLVGTCAIAASRLGRVDTYALDEQRDVWIDRFDGSESKLNTIDSIHIVPATLAAAFARGSKPFAQEIEAVGVLVSEETSDEWNYDGDEEEERRHNDVRAYLRDLIATDLRLLGVSVPRKRT